MVLARSSECAGRFGSLVVSEYCVCRSLKAVTDCGACCAVERKVLQSIRPELSFPRAFLRGVKYRNLGVSGPQNHSDDGLCT